MLLRIGFEMRYSFPQPTPAILMLNVHSRRVSDLVAPDHLIVRPSVPITGYRDGFGNWCSRLVMPTGEVVISTDTLVRDDGATDPVVATARQSAVEDIPEGILGFPPGKQILRL